jgi:hypothetical protein
VEVPWWGNNQGTKSLHTILQSRPNFLELHSNLTLQPHYTNSFRPTTHYYYNPTQPTDTQPPRHISSSNLPQLLPQPTNQHHTNCNTALHSDHASYQNRRLLPTSTTPNTLTPDCTARPRTKAVVLARLTSHSSGLTIRPTPNKPTIITRPATSLLRLAWAINQTIFGC